MAVDTDEVFILKFSDNSPDGENHHIGLLIEQRSDSGELIEMYIECFEGELEELIGDNLLHFKKFSASRYVYAGFEQYPDYNEILIDVSDGSDDPSRIELQKVIKYAEDTITTIRSGAPVQEWTRDDSGRQRILNKVRPRKPRRLSDIGR